MTKKQAKRSEDRIVSRFEKRVAIFVDTLLRRWLGWKLQKLDNPLPVSLPTLIRYFEVRVGKYQEVNADLVERLEALERDYPDPRPSTGYEPNVLSPISPPTPEPESDGELD